MNRQLNTSQALLSLMGIIAWVVALLFATDQTVKVNSTGPEAANIVAAGAVCGFAIAGGLCLLGAGLISRTAPTDSPRSLQSTDIPESKH